MTTPTTKFQDFTLPMVTPDGVKNVELSTEAKDKTLILAFFPAAYAPYCVTEMETLKKEYQNFKSKNAEIIGISGDLPWALAKFKEEKDIPFDLVSDNTFEASKAYGTYLKNPMGNGMDFSNRGIFIVKNNEIVYEWKGEDPTKQPLIDEIMDHL